MILVDANLLYAHVSTFSQHEKARECLDTFGRFSGLRWQNPLAAN
jgi:hypothetical protein